MQKKYVVLFQNQISNISNVKIIQTYEEDKEFSDNKMYSENEIEVFKAYVGYLDRSCLLSDVENRFEKKISDFDTKIDIKTLEYVLSKSTNTIPYYKRVELSFKYFSKNYPYGYSLMLIHPLNSITVYNEFKFFPLHECSIYPELEKEFVVFIKDNTFRIKCFDIDDVSRNTLVDIVWVGFTNELEYNDFKSKSKEQIREFITSIKAIL